MKEITQRLEDLKSKLDEKGINTDNIDDLFELAKEYKAIQEEKEKFRDRQFWDDAYDLGADIKAANKIEAISKFLRRFAEHVVTHAISTSYTSIEDVVDNIPSMVEKEEHE